MKFTTINHCKRRYVLLFKVIYYNLDIQKYIRKLGFNNIKSHTIPQK